MPRRQELHAARSASKERRAQLVFERPNLTCERRLREMKALGRATEVALLGDDHEILELRETHARKLTRLTAARIVAPERRATCPRPRHREPAGFPAIPKRYGPATDRDRTLPP